MKVNVMKYKNGICTIWLAIFYSILVNFSWILTTEQHIYTKMGTHSEKGRLYATTA